MRKRNLVLAILSGLLLAAALPKPGIWAGSWVGLVPLILALRGVRPREAALYGLLTGAVYYGIIIFWISIFGYLPWALVVVTQAAFIALFAAVAAVLMRGRPVWWTWATVPAAWTAMQWLRSLPAFSFTWGSFAHTQANVLPVIQIASLTGPWGIDFVVCLVNVAMAGLLFPAGTKRPWTRAAVVAVLTATVIVTGWASLRGGVLARPNVKIAVIQGSITHSVNPDAGYLRRALMTYEDMTLQAARRSPDFVIWPETTLTADISTPDWTGMLSSLARRVRSNLVVGGYDSSGDPSVPESYNGAHFFARTGAKLGVYHKVRLVPYGEYVPLRDRMPFLRRYQIRDVDVLPGKSHNLIDTDIGKVGVSICFESLFPDISRQETKRGAVVLFVITNDAWFLHTQAARQHMMMARLRAVENRRYLVRAAGTGVSAVIDPYGRTISELGIFKDGIVEAKVAPKHGLTLYARLGECLVYLCLGITLAGLALARGRKAP